MEKEEKKALKKKKLLHFLFQVLNESRKKRSQNFQSTLFA